MDDLKANIHSVLIPYKEGIPANKFLQEYESATTENLVSREYGFENLNKLILSMPDTVRVVHGTYFAVVNESTAAISRLVASQKSQKRTKSRPVRGRASIAASRSIRRGSKPSSASSVNKPPPLLNKVSQPCLDPKTGVSDSFQKQFARMWSQPQPSQRGGGSASYS